MRWRSKQGRKDVLYKIRENMWRMEEEEEE